MRELRADLAVAGGGPAGIAAACAASARGKKVVVIDRQAEPGGQIWRGQRNEWLARLQASGSLWLGRAEIVDARPGFLLKTLTPEGATAIHAGQLVLATGARELFLPFPGWTLPRVYGAGGLQALVKSGLAVRGLRVAVAGSGPLLAAAAGALLEAGAHVLRVVEQAERAQLSPFFRIVAARPARWLQAADLCLRLAGRYQFGAWPVEAAGRNGVETVLLSSGERLRVDALACGFGLVPNVEIAQALGCRLSAGGFVQVDARQQTSVAGVFAAGEICGIGGADVAISEGLTAGGQQTAIDTAYREALERSFRLRDELRHLPRPDTIVCRCEDAAWSRIEPHQGWREAKLQTRCGMGACQGRVCGAALAYLKGWPAPELRAPFSPAPLEFLARE